MLSEEGPIIVALLSSVRTVFIVYRLLTRLLTVTDPSKGHESEPDILLRRGRSVFSWLWWSLRECMFRRPPNFSN